MRPTVNKIFKTQEELAKMLSRLSLMESELKSMSHNPKGSNVEISKSMKRAAREIGLAQEALQCAKEILNPVVTTLRGRQKK